jgi:hypothetical protein
MTMKTVPISSLLNGLQNHLGADCPMHGITPPPGRRSQTAGNSLTAIPACPIRCPDAHAWPRLTQETYAVSLPGSVLMLICCLWAPACAHRSAHLALGGVGGQGGVIMFTPR